MTGPIIAFPKNRTRRRGVLPPTQRAECFERLSGIASGLRQTGSGELMTSLERDRWVHDLLSRIEEARKKLHGKK